MTTRRAPRDAAARDRLERLARQASAQPPIETGDLPADQPWVDLSKPPDDSDADAVAPADPDPAGRPWWRRGMAGRLLERWVPDGEPPSLRRPRPIVIAGAVVLAIGVAAGLLVSGGRVREPAPELPAASVSAAPATAADPTGTVDGGPIVVSVIGKVGRPGLVTVPDGARVADALQAAGGPLPGVDLGGLNLARRLSDGEQIAVGIPQPADPAGPPGSPGSPGPPAKIDLNSASVAALDALPGVGQVTAQRIVDWRTAHGRFSSVEQLREIDGIGPTRFAKLKDLVVVR